MFESSTLRNKRTRFANVNANSGEQRAALAFAVAVLGSGLVLPGGGHKILFRTGILFGLLQRRIEHLAGHEIQETRHLRGHAVHQHILLTQIRMPENRCKRLYSLDNRSPSPLDLQELCDGLGELRIGLHQPCGGIEGGEPAQLLVGFFDRRLHLRLLHPGRNNTCLAVHPGGPGFIHTHVMDIWAQFWVSRRATEYFCDFCEGAAPAWDGLVRAEGATSWKTRFSMAEISVRISKATREPVEPYPARRSRGMCSMPAKRIVRSTSTI